MSGQPLLLTYQPQPKKLKLSLRQHKYKLNRLKGMNQYNAARAAGYSENTAKSKSGRIEKVVRSTLYDLLERKGLTDEALAQHIADGLEATKLYGKDADEGPDWATRHKYAITALQLKGHMKESEVIQNSDTNTVQVLIINKGNDGTGICNTQERGNGQRIDIGAEAVLRFSEPRP